MRFIFFLDIVLLDAYLKRNPKQITYNEFLAAKISAKTIPPAVASRNAGDGVDTTQWANMRRLVPKYATDLDCPPQKKKASLKNKINQQQTFVAPRGRLIKQIVYLDTPNSKSDIAKDLCLNDANFPVLTPVFCMCGNSKKGMEMQGPVTLLLHEKKHVTFGASIMSVSL